MAGKKASDDFDKWKKNTKKTAHIKFVKVKEADNQLELTIGSKKDPFVLNYPSSYPDLSDDNLTVFSEPDHMSDWNNYMMEYCERRRTLDEVLSEAAEYYLKKFPEKSSSSSKSKSSSSSSKKKEQADEPDFDFDADPFSKEEEPVKKKETPSGPKAENFFTGSGSKAATDRLIKDLTSIMKSENEAFGYSANPIQDDLYHWEVKFFGFEKGSPLEQDMQQMKKKKGLDHILLDVRFPADYPFSPPFVRVVKPRFAFRTGHVTVGGSICMEMLTRSGWIPCNDIESILVSIRSEMLEGGGRLDLNNTNDYSEEEAKQAFKRVAQQHGWEK